ncbi:hypothetical protein MCFN_00195 [Mycoplasmopsis californica]|uniref:Uncharacterized protein n=1 Tax=Mycoplasmopsis californica TaxID=2113 RepID=A0A059XQZ6_9BACT|nr:hypothetical protein [Mycoplasmopsis californica]AIA29218.1 hypothetical protein MCFN_00195 [Mycoplasmopsis californica]
MNNKDKIIDKFNRATREFNGYSVSNMNEIVNDFVNLIDQMEVEIKSFKDVINNLTIENSNLQSTISKYKFQQKTTKLT